MCVLQEAIHNGMVRCSEQEDETIYESAYKKGHLVNAYSSLTSTS